MSKNYIEHVEGLFKAQNMNCTLYEQDISATWKAMKSKWNGYIYVLVGCFSPHISQCEKIDECHDLNSYVNLLRMFTNLDAGVHKTVSHFLKL
jgi:hypothetical protein